MEPELGPRSSRRWHLAWRGGVGLAVVLIVGAVLHRAWLWAAERQLAAALAAVRAAGEPTTAAELTIPDDVPDADNGSLDYKRAAALLHPTSAAWKRFDDLPDFTPFTPPLTPDERALAATLCDGERPALAAAADGRGKRAGSWHEAVDPTALMAADAMDLKGARLLSRLLAVAALDAATAGDGPGAIDRLTDAVALADASERRPTLIGHLVAVGVTAAAAEAVERAMPLVTVTAADRPATASLLHRLLDERPMRDGRTLEWRSERLFGTALLDRLADGHMAPGPSPSPPGGSELVTLARPLIVADTARYVDHMTGVQRAAAAADWPAARAALPTGLLSAAAAHPILHLAVRIALPPFDKAVQAEFRDLAARRLAAVAVAARLFAADHGGRAATGWPDLVPGYLPAVPVDPMDGRPLRLVDGPPRAYSVGLDERDDGGRPVDESAPVRLRHGDDVAYLVVHPRPSTSPSPPR